MDIKQSEKIEKAIEALRPEARELIQLAKKDITTKDGYGKVMSFLAMMPSKQMGSIFLASMIREGYPIQTANQLGNIMGYSN